MPTFVILARDKPGHEELRVHTRPAHLQHLELHASSIVAAGAMLDEHGASPVGSVLIVDIASADDAARFIESDPYSVAGLFASVEVRPIRMVYPGVEERSMSRSD